MPTTSEIYSTGDITYTACGGEEVGGVVTDDTTKWTVTNKNGMSIGVTDYGATLVSCIALDKEGEKGETLIFFDSLKDYALKGAGHGATIGRYANRIAQGQFVINGTTYQAPVNDWGRPNCLHAGRIPWQHQKWDAEEVEDDGVSGVKFSLVSPDGAEGFPGEVTISVTYSLSDNDDVRIYYEATTDQDTIINVTNHGYWNLSGDHKRSARTHEFSVNAKEYLPVDENCIPTNITEVEGTPFDLRKLGNVGERIDAANGFDNCFVIDKSNDPVHVKPSKVSGGSATPSVHVAAVCMDPESGRKMTVLTSEPGVQVYNYNHASADDKDAPHTVYWGICFEAEHYPNSCNRTSWPPTQLNKGDTYKQLTVHRFSTK
ncbi:hypothetical protein SARC_02391 [Sphaeroforma arctica JP610]|uniref:Aldose 1-epimerase n=1 Tax=Sphaeroforma arctica JP610 TaxID=667725 RepID=A0A0L0G979_9EUKA|nr:hypothetical protein SARC_02391 [Sphaeroforma arctica JP610]KNC85441.1 hypothetical protein SARC_02391 [Sphaeroforma arctica JP610]|eukprot:XP_014159343.1 hypothetical protein SARC_02391 [Sphaeroforma arctica JP610]